MPNPKNQVLRLKYDLEKTFKKLASQDARKPTETWLEDKNDSAKLPSSILDDAPRRIITSAHIPAPVRNFAALSASLTKGVTDNDVLERKYGNTKTVPDEPPTNTKATPTGNIRWLAFGVRDRLCSLTALPADGSRHLWTLRDGHSHIQKPNPTIIAAIIAEANANSGKDTGRRWVDAASAITLLRQYNFTGVEIAQKLAEADLKPVIDADHRMPMWGIRNNILFRFDPQNKNERYLGRHYYPGKKGWENANTYVCVPSTNLMPSFDEPGIQLLSVPRAMLWLLENGYREEVQMRMPEIAWRTKNNNIVHISLVNRHGLALRYLVFVRDKRSWEDHTKTYPQLDTIMLIQFEKYGWEVLSRELTQQWTEQLEKLFPRVTA